VVEDLAVGSHSGVTELFECLGHQGSLSSLRPPGNDATARRQVIQVPITTLDDYVKDRKFDSLTAIKLDVEGAELAALQGGMEALNAFRPVLLCEMEDARTVPWGYRAKDIYEMLFKELGYQ